MQKSPSQEAWGLNCIEPFLSVRPNSSLVIKGLDGEVDVVVFHFAGHILDDLDERREFCLLVLGSAVHLQYAKAWVWVDELVKLVILSFPDEALADFVD